MSLPDKAYPPAPVQAQRFVDTLGVVTTIEFLLNFGGSEVFLSGNPKGRGMIERVIGYEATAALQEVSDDLCFRVPLANKWLAQCLFLQGLSTNTIARRLRVSTVSVRKYIAPLHGDAISDSQAYLGPGSKGTR